MEAHKIANLLNNEIKQPSKYVTKIGLKQKMMHMGPITPIVKFS